MKPSWTGLITSIFIHAVLVVAVMSMGHFVTTKPQIRTIDFSILDSRVFTKTNQTAGTQAAASQADPGIKSLPKQDAKTGPPAALKTAAKQEPPPPASRKAPPQKPALPESPILKKRIPKNSATVSKPIAKIKPAPKVINNKKPPIKEPKPIPKLAAKQSQDIKAKNIEKNRVPQPITKTPVPLETEIKKTPPNNATSVPTHHISQLKNFDRSVATANLSTDSGKTGSQSASPGKLRSNFQEKPGAHVNQIDDHTFMKAGAGNGGHGTPGGKPDHEFIRAHLRDHLIYPPIARKKGWAGKVLVSFTLMQDGNANDIKVENSCGFALLDKSALKTVQNACPFPKPPYIAKIIIPVVYKLN